MKRREFLRLGAGTVAGTIAGSIGLLSWSPRARAQTISVNLTTMHGDVMQVDGTTAFMFGFSDTGVLTVPGPTIVCQSGDSIELTIANALDTPAIFAVTGTNIQLRVSARTTLQFAPFTAPAPGSYLYHDNQNGGVNRVLGLHGALIVMPAAIKNRAFIGGPSFSRQYKWILGNVDPVWGDAVRANGDAYVGSIVATSFLPRYFTINGNSFENTHEPNTDLHGLYGEPALVRIMSAGGMVHAPHFHGNHIEICSINRTNYASNRKSKDIVSMFPLDCRDVLVPFRRPADAWPRITNEVQHFPMHCHSEMSQTAGGGMYPHGMHCQLVLGQRPTVESEVTQTVARLP